MQVVERHGRNMKKFMKGCAWTALILIVVGFVLVFTAGSVKGAEEIRDVVDKVTDGRVRVDFTELFAMEESAKYEIDENMIFDDAFEIFNGDINKNFAGETVCKLDVEVGGCQFRIKESAEDYFRVAAEGTRKFQGYVAGETLFIKGTMKTGDHSEIILYVPKDFVFERMDMELGAGAMDLGDIRAEKLDLEVGAGQITAGCLAVEELLVSAGMGEIIIEDIQTQKLDAAVGMGNLQAKGMVTEKVSVECAMGNINLRLEGMETDYDYEIACGMGSVTIGENTYNGLDNEKSVNNAADRKMDVECAVGNVEIQFY